MKLVVFGAAGRTGSLVTKAAGAAGHEVTAFVRDPSRLDDATGVRVAVGDATVQSDVDRALDGQDALISALGPRSLLQADVVAPAAAVFVAGARAAGLSRLVHLSAFGVGATADQANPLVRTAFRTVLRGYFRDKTAADETIEQSGLDWTVVQPVTLADGPPTGRLTAAATLSRNAGKAVRRADVAQFMVDCLFDAQWSRRTVVLAS